jgi:hypothetical protein
MDYNAIPTWMQRQTEAARREAVRRYKTWRKENWFAKYRDKPVEFGEDILGHRYTDDVKRVMESVRDNTVTIARSANGVGKTHCAAALASWFWKVWWDSQVYITAAPPLDNLKRLLWGELLNIVKLKPQLWEHDKVRDLEISRSPKSFIAGVPIPMTGTSAERVSKFSGKHAPRMLFILDEGDAVPDEVYTGIEGCMSGGMVRMLILFNPKSKRGPVFEKEAAHKANVVALSAFNHPNVVTGSDIIPGAVTRDVTVRRINEWTRPLVEGESGQGDDIFAVPDYLVGHVALSDTGSYFQPLPAGKRAIIDPAFAYMVLGVYPQQAESQLIADEWIAQARARWDVWVQMNGERPPAGAPGRLGLDVAEFGTDYNVCYLRYGGFVARPSRWNGVDPIVTGDKALMLWNRAREGGMAVDMCFVDGTGPGSGTAPYMARKQRGVRCISVKVSDAPSPTIKSSLGEFYQKRDQLWWACREWLRTDPTAMLPPAPLLLEELRIPNYWVDDKGRVRITSKEGENGLRNILKRSPNDAEALVLTFDPQERAKILEITT